MIYNYNNMEIQYYIFLTLLDFFHDCHVRNFRGASYDHLRRFARAAKLQLPGIRVEAGVQPNGNRVTLMEPMEVLLRMWGID